MHGFQSVFVVLAGKIAFISIENVYFLLPTVEIVILASKKVKLRARKPEKCQKSLRDNEPLTGGTWDQTFGKSKNSEAILERFGN